MEDASDLDDDTGNCCSADQQPLFEEVLSQESPGSMPSNRNKPRRFSADEWTGSKGQDDYADFPPASSRCDDEGYSLFEGSEYPDSDAYDIDGSEIDVDSLTAWRPKMRQMLHEIDDVYGAHKLRPPPPSRREARQAYPPSGATGGRRPWTPPPPPQPEARQAYPSSGAAGGRRPWAHPPPRPGARQAYPSSGATGGRRPWVPPPPPPPRPETWQTYPPNGATVGGMPWVPPPSPPPWPEFRQTYPPNGATVGGMPWASPPSPALPEWRDLRRTELHPPMDLKPTLPEGWDFRLDPENRVFYVNTYARGNEKRCFWNAPVKAGRADFAKCPKAWQKICNIFGRIYWLHEKSGIMSYKHPDLVEDFWHNPQDGELYIRDKESKRFNHWFTLRKLDHSIDDTDVIPRIHPDVWEHGISDEATEMRGELWWGNSDVNEMNLRLTPKPSQKYEGEEMIVINLDNNTTTTVRKWAKEEDK